MVKEIKLTKGYIALVDDDDYEWLSEYKWRPYADPLRPVVYVRTSIDGVTTSMHRLIGERYGFASDDRQVDHIDNNPLNNQKSNLRPVSRSQNAYNQKAYRNNTSGFKGVHYNKRSRSWTAVIKAENVRYDLGYYSAAGLAAFAYNEAATVLHGEFAVLNNVPPIDSETASQIKQKVAKRINRPRTPPAQSDERRAS